MFNPPPEFRAYLNASGIFAIRLAALLNTFFTNAS